MTEPKSMLGRNLKINMKNIDMIYYSAIMNYSKIQAEETVSSKLIYV